MNVVCNRGPQTVVPAGTAHQILDRFERFSMRPSNAGD